MKIFDEITLAEDFLDNAQMAGIVKKIVNNFDYKWMRIIFHESDFLKQLLDLFLPFAPKPRSRRKKACGKCLK